MNKENIIVSTTEESNVRITRARAKALDVITPKVIEFTQKFPSIKNKELALRINLKRAASDENKSTADANAGLKNKRKAVLKDVTNFFAESSYMNCINATKVQLKKQAVRCPVELAPSLTSRTVHTVKDMSTDVYEGLSYPPILVKQSHALPVSLNDNVSIHSRSSFNSVESKGKAGQDAFTQKLWKLGIVDIDYKQKDPILCSDYVADIYNQLFITELKERPSANYMETVQRDVTQSMRGILVDWLVEVSEEYKLVPNTLYLTVNLIDRFLSYNYIDKQRLQLLGVACMLISSKYEEMCAPHIEEFCFITDNTYTKQEVLKMETRVLKFLNYRLSSPTPKTFMRRFLRAAQACFKVPCVELEFLANYLLELTLADYNFIKFLPSLVAASTIFLTRWTIDSSHHPWNPTLEYYTHYKATQLKTSVFALQDLQMSINGCSLDAVRNKYMQQKFKCVANLTSKKLDQSLFLKLTD